MASSSSGAHTPPEAQVVGGVHIRQIEVSEVGANEVELRVRTLIDRVIQPGNSYELTLAELDIGLVPFRSRVYRAADRLGLVSHVYQAPSKRGVVQIYSHAPQSQCTFCHQVAHRR